MIDAGQHIHYQHYKPLDRLVRETPAVLTAIVALEAAAVLYGLTVHRAAIRSWIRKHMRLRQVIVVAAIACGSAVALSRSVPTFLAELAFACLIQGIALGAIVLFAMTLPDRPLAWAKQRCERLLEGPATHRGLDRFAAVCALWVTVVSGFMAAAVYEKHPHVEDEVAYLYQARFLAAGRLTLPAPPVPRAFETYLMDVENGRWFATPPAGWPALLAVGVLLGAPWLVNPVLAGVNILLAYLLLTRLYDRRIARISLILLCASPWYLFLGMSFMTHPFSLTAALTAALAVEKAGRTGQARWAYLAGIAGGVVGLIRPLEGAIVLGLLGLWSLGLGGPRLRLSGIAGLVIAAGLTSALVLPYNAHLTGNARVFPVMAYTDKKFGKNSNALGFGPERGRGFGWALTPFPGHDWRGAVVNSELNAFGLNTELLGWGTGSLLLAGFAATAGKRRGADLMMLSAIAAVIGAHAFYWFSGGPDFGARYWYLVIVPLIALTARGIEELESKPGGSRVMPAVLALAALAVINYLPWRATDKYFGYLGMRPGAVRLAREHGFGRSLILIRGYRFPDYASASPYNPLDLHASEPVYVWDENAAVRAEILRAYSDRPVWLVDGPSVSSTGTYQIKAGPLRANELIR
jgi:hypothetical protein